MKKWKTWIQSQAENLKSSELSVEIVQSLAKLESEVSEKNFSNKRDIKGKRNLGRSFPKVSAALS